MYVCMYVGGVDEGRKEKKKTVVVVFGCVWCFIYVKI